MALWDEDISDFKCCCSLFYTPRRIQSSLSAFLIIMFHRKNSADHPSSDNQPLLQISRQALYQPPSLRQSQEKENCDRWWCGCRQKRFIHFWMNSWCWSIYTDFIRSENWNDISRDHISETLFTKTLFVLVAFNVCLKCKCHRHSVNYSFKKQKSFLQTWK